MISVFIFAFLILIVRLSQVMVFNGNDDENSLYMNAPTMSSRADIVDRNNNIIATSLPTVSLYACPHEIIDFNEAAEKTCFVFTDMKKDKFLRRMKKAKRFLWVKRNLSPKQEQEILNQGIPGFHFLKTEKREGFFLNSERISSLMRGAPRMEEIDSFCLVSFIR